MSGATNLRGLAGYQQRYLTFRVLSTLGMRSLGQESLGPELREFSIEGRTSENAPCWDVRLALSDNTVELDECKDTKITRPDRLIFYDRLREEIASGTPAGRITPTWVTDERKQSPNMLSFLGGIPAAVENLDLASVKSALPDRVLSTDDAIQEAIYRLCHYTGEEDSEKGKDKEGSKKKTKKVPRRCTFEEAKTVLKRLRIARHRFKDLDQSVKLLVTGAFNSGTADSVYKFITGVLTDEIVTKGEARFTIDAFIQAVGTTVLSRDVEGRVRHLLSFNAASGFLQQIRLIRWTRLHGAPTTEWDLAERVPTYNPAESCLFVAGMGIGKTVASQMAFEEEAGRQHPGRVIRLEARSLDREDLEAAVRLLCILCGVGPAWLAIDGLDEVPHGLRPDWERSLGALTVLPNLTLLVTVRREVLAAREWLVNITAMLTPVEIQNLEPAQVEGAFLGAGIRAPTNPRLIQALRNPFLLSLYADVVTPDDMPLAESGEVTAFQVIDEFWKRRVRGVSEGQRAVGESEASQEPKRLAAVFLADRVLAGDFAVPRSSSDPQVSTGLEMLLHEGVIREQGAGAVAWIHEWLREYALVDRLLSRCDTLSAVTLARRIVADCTIDHVARAAAAGGVKWVMANPAAGTPVEFVSELWRLSPGLARESLSILLEGSPSALALGDLTDDVLFEAVTLAVHLRATQWGPEAARLADQRFFGPRGDDLHAVTVEYELRIAPGSAEPAGDTVRRLVDRDLRRWNAGRGPLLKTFATLLEKIVTTGSFRDGAVQAWLVELSGTVDGYSFGKFRDALLAILAAGEVGTAHAMFRSAVGLEDNVRGNRIADAVVRRRFVYEGDLIGILSTSGLLADNVSTWGETAVAFLANLVEAKQRKGWPSTRRFLAALGSPLPRDAAFAPNVDEDPRVTTLDADEDEPIVRVAVALSAALQELAQLDEKDAFLDLADKVIQARFAALIALPLLVLYDAARGALPRKSWHVEESIRLLSDDNITQLKSLNEVRQLLRRVLPGTLDQGAREAVVGAIRRSSLPESMRIRELADLQGWVQFTSQELEEIAKAAAAKDLDEPTDPREERLFGIERGSPPERPEQGTGWPHPEDDDRIRLLRRGVTEPEEPVSDGPEQTPLARQLEAISVVVNRPEAMNDEWLGQTLGWCHRAIERLRRTVEPEDDEARGKQLSNETWLATLDRQAPWWSKMAVAALSRLNATVPDQHVKKELTESRLSWFSGDPIASALDLLDELLAIDPAPPFDGLQEQLAQTVAAKWRVWPPFTKALTLSSLRVWFWHRFPVLRAILTETIRSEPNPVVVRYAVDRLVEMVFAGPTPELSEFVKRAAAGGHGDSLREVGKVLGSAAVAASPQSTGSRSGELADLFRQALAISWPDPEALSDLLEGALIGATDSAQQEEWNSEIEHEWLRTIESLVTHWPFDKLGGEDRERFPLHVLWSVIDREASPTARARLLLGLLRTLETILRKADLGAYCTLHFELNGLVAGRHQHISGKREREWRAGMPASDSVENACRILCRASVERVVAWKREGKRTDDLGWRSGLDGRDAAELVKACMDASRERERMRRELIPLVDMLADAGLTNVAADLRAHLRKA